MRVFRSAFNDVTVHESGWFDLPNGGSITKLPLWDKAHSIFAQFTRGLGRAFLETMGARLPPNARMNEMRKHALFIDPYTLPTKAMLLAAKVPRPWAIGGRDTPAMADYRAARMSTLEWAKLHTAEVLIRLDTAHWSGEEPIYNAGKHWVYEGIAGWMLRNGSLIEELHNSHGDHHCDYGTTVHGYSPGGPVFKWSDGLNLAYFSIGLRTLAWAGFQSASGIKEIAGSRHNEIILAYSRHCRRGGTFRGVDKWGNALWSGGSALPLSRDEDPWCAAFASEGLRCSLLPGEAPSHGLRVSVRELCEDARITGAYRDKSVSPEPGWLAIRGRLGESPTLGGRGHVHDVVSLDGDKYLAIGGNESNAIGVESWPLSEAHAWIAR